jgi:hypothetical protein
VARCQRQVPAHDRRSGVGVDVLDADRLAAAVAQHGMIAGGPDVAQPVRVLAEHRHQVLLALVVDDDQRKRQHTTGAAPGDLQRHEAPGQQSAPVDDRPAAVEQSSALLRSIARLTHRTATS